MKSTKNKNELVKIVFTALFAALTCVSTMIIKIPTLTNGYVHLGDAMVLVSGWLLGPVYGVLAAAIGSMFADIFGSYFIYAPATFVIKGLVALLAYLFAGMMKKFAKKHTSIAYIVSALIAELAMVGGYYVFEATVAGYGFIGAAVGIPANILQGISGIVIGTILIVVLNETHITERFITKYGFLDR